MSINADTFKLVFEHDDSPQDDVARLIGESTAEFHMWSDTLGEQA